MPVNEKNSAKRSRAESRNVDNREMRPPVAAPGDAERKARTTPARPKAGSPVVVDCGPQQTAGSAPANALERKLISMGRSETTGSSLRLPSPNSNQSRAGYVESGQLLKAVQRCFGTSDPDVQGVLFGQLSGANCSQSGGNDWVNPRQMGLVGMLHQIAPGNLHKAFAAIRWISGQENAMEFFKRARDPNLSPEHAQIYANIGFKFSRMTDKLSESFNRCRGQAEQEENGGKADPNHDSESIVRYTETSQRTVEHREKRKRKRS